MTPREQQEDWTALLQDNPRVLWGLVADVVKAVKAGEGERKTGRRPAVSVKSLDELYDILFPPCYQTEPFGVALSMALEQKRMTQRALSVASGVDQSIINKYISGARTPSLDAIERIAAGVGVRPVYFAEYRAQKIGSLVAEYLVAEPHQSAESVRRLFGAPA